MMPRFLPLCLSLLSSIIVAESLYTPQVDLAFKKGNQRDIGLLNFIQASTLLSKHISSALPSNEVLITRD